MPVVARHQRGSPSDLSVSLADLVVETEPTITVLSGDLDQFSLHEVLDRVRALGLELVEIKQAP